MSASALALLDRNVVTDLTARRASEEAAKLAKQQNFGPVVTRALMDEAARRSRHVDPVIAARVVVKHADAPVFDPPGAA